MDEGTQRAIAQAQRSIAKFSAQRASALATASAKDAEARAFLAKAEEYEALARDAVATAQGLRGFAGVPATAGPHRAFSGQSGSALGGAVGAVRDVHGMVKGSWTGAAFDAFNASVGTIRNSIETPTFQVQAFFSTSAANCEQLAAQATVKGAEQRVLAIAATNAASQARMRANSLAGSIRSANHRVSSLQREAAS